MLPSRVITAGKNFLALTDPCAGETGRPSKTHHFGQIQPHIFGGHSRTLAHLGVVSPVHGSGGEAASITVL